MDVGGHRNNYEGFNEKYTYQMSTRRRRTITAQGAHTSLEEEIQTSKDHVDIDIG